MAVTRKKPGSKSKKKAAKRPAPSKKPAAKAKKGTTSAKPKKVAAKSAKKSSAAKAKKATARNAKATAKKVVAKAKPKKTVAAKSTKKPKATATTARKPAQRERVAAPLPSERAIAIAAQRPEERALTDKEREAMTKIAQTALALLEPDPSATPDAVTIVRKIAAYVDDVRAGARPEPKTDDERLGIGVLWGEQVRAQVGWRWVHLSYADGFASYALVPDDRAFACFPLNRLAELARQQSNGANTSVPLFDSIRAGTLPQRRENAYLVIG